METITGLLALGLGLLIRLALPIAITLVLVYFLRKLDTRWQLEAELQPVSAQRHECWKIKGCSPEQRRECPAFSSPVPCWQVFRLPNGYLREDCLACNVFMEAPVPALPDTTPIS